ADPADLPRWSSSWMLAPRRDSRAFPVEAQLVPPAGRSWQRRPTAHSFTGVDRNRTDWERCLHPPLVLKTRANTSCANTPKAIPPIVRPSELSALLAI